MNLVVPRAILIGIDPATTGTTGLAVLGLGEPILASINGIEWAGSCPALNEIESRLAVLAEPVHIGVGIEYPRFNNRRGGGAYTVRAAANAWSRVIEDRFIGAAGVERVWLFRVDPPVWQSALLGDAWKALGTKRVALMRANELLGLDTFDHNVADAICIAEFTKGLFRDKVASGVRKIRQRRRSQHPRINNNAHARHMRDTQRNKDEDSHLD